MSQPVDPRFPPEVAGSPRGGEPPAAAATPAPVYDRLGKEWSWVPGKGQYVCEDPTYLGPGVTSPGAIPPDRQPYYAHPPTPLQQALAEETEEY